VVDACVETLILGSFPSAASLAAGQYYAHPRNQFWPILAAVLAEPLTDMPYAKRLVRLRAHAIGLWDVVGSCERTGSLDAAIRNSHGNDVEQLLRRVPRLRRVLFNGQAAGRAAGRFHAAGLVTAVLPSSSPALATLRLDAKIALWQLALQGRCKPADARKNPLDLESGAIRVQKGVMP
jgi:hypoxanthine-DNA glycosylase